MLSFIIPVRQDRRASQAVRRLREWAIQYGKEAEIFVCGEVFSDQDLGAAIHVEVNPAAKGACVRAGVLASHGEDIVVCDADVPVSDGELLALVGGLDAADVVMGRRYTVDDNILDNRSPWRKLASVIFRWLAILLFRLPYGFDPQCGAKAFRATVAQRLFRNLAVFGFAYEVEIARCALDLELRIATSPVLVRHEISTLNLLRDGFCMLLDLLRLAATRFLARGATARSSVHIAAELKP